METIEASGRTIEEAVQMAAAELGVTTDAVEYEIVEEGSKGFLGLGQIPCLIKAWIKEGAAESVPAQAPETAARADEVRPAEPEPVRSERRPSTPVEPRPAPEVPSAPEQGFAGAITDILDQVLSAMNVDVRAVLRSDDKDETWVEITGSDVAILIGKQGQTLDALQYLVGIAATRASGEKKRLILDAEGYRDKHRQTLERVAHDYAREVKAQGQEAELEPQPARDRRIVHMALADDPDVYTYSEGEGDDRHVVISPKK